MKTNDDQPIDIDSEINIIVDKYGFIWVSATNTLTDEEVKEILRQSINAIDESSEAKTKQQTESTRVKFKKTIKHLSIVK